MIENLNRSLSDYFKLERFKNKVSQEEMAEKLGISRNTYISWENNPIQLSIGTLNNISDKLGSDIIIFFKEYVAKSNNKNQEQEKEE